MTLKRADCITSEIPQSISQWINPVSLRAALLRYQRNNLGEVIDGTVYMIDHPQASLDKLMEFIPGPDFSNWGHFTREKMKSESL